MLPFPTNRLFKLLNKKEDILSTILEKIRQGENTYSLPEHTFMQEQFKQDLILFPQYYSRAYTGIYSEYCFAKNQNLSMVL